MVTVGTATAGEKELKTKWPITEGLILGTTKLKKKPLLKAQVRLTKPRNRVGLE